MENTGEEIQESRDIIRDIHGVAEHSTDCIFILDREFRALSVNGQAAETLDISSEGILGKTLCANLPLTHPELLSRAGEALASARPSELEECMAVNGNDTGLDIRLSPIKAESDGFVGLLCIARDIPAQKSREQSISGSRQAWLPALDKMPHPIVLRH